MSVKFDTNDVEFDIDETRVDGVEYRFVHGHFRGTQTQFCILLPDPGCYAGRFLQNLQGGLGGDEYSGLRKQVHRSAFDLGAVFVDCNQGHIGADMSGLEGDLSVLAWRASAATARLAQQLALDHYEGEHSPPVGIVSGGSAGGMRVLECLRHAPDLYRGGVAYMINRTDLTPFNWSISAWASLCLGDKLDLVAADVAGFYEAASDDERQVLDALYLAGYPQGAEDQLGPNPLWAMGIAHVKSQDPEYFELFWADERFAGGAGDIALPIEEHLVVEELVDAKALLADKADPLDINLWLLASTPGDHVAGIRFTNARDVDRFAGAEFILPDGIRVYATGGIDGVATALLSPQPFSGLMAGDTVRVCRRDLIAFAYYHRHSVAPGYPGMRQFWEQGSPMHAQRPTPAQERFARLDSKLIVMQHLQDKESWPTIATLFSDELRESIGDGIEDSYRLYWTNSAQHFSATGEPSKSGSKYIDYYGLVNQALTDMAAWVTCGRIPARSTAYEISDCGHLVLADPEDPYAGIQPSIKLLTNRSRRVIVDAGSETELVATAVARASDELVRLEFDALGTGGWQQLWAGASSKLHHSWKHCYAVAGTWRPAVRVIALRAGSATGYELQNIDSNVVIAR